MKANFSLYVALLIIFLVIILDLFYFEPTRQPESFNDIFMVLEEGHPKFTLNYIFRTLLLALSSFLIVFSVINHPKSIFKSNRVFEADAFSGWGNFTWMNDSLTKVIFSKSVKKLLLWLHILLFLFLIFLFYDRPGFFSKISMEDALVENLSAFFYFLAFGIFVYITLLIFRFNSSVQKKVALIIAISFCFIFFILGMEEISWFQRVLSIDSPEYFKEHNAQKELNIHNFFMEPIYVTTFYVSAFILLILIPFLYEHFSNQLKNSILKLFIPDRFILFLSVMIVAYNYDQWNLFIIQLCFYITLFILLYYCWIYSSIINNYFVVSSLLIVYVLTQVIFLIYGERQLVREWEVTEYKEFLIPLAYFFYSIEILVRLKNRKTELSEIKIEKVAAVA